MDEVRRIIQDDQGGIALAGYIDSNNAPAVEVEIMTLIQEDTGESIIIDTQDLEYISSAGLRVLMHLRKNFPQLRIINVNPGIYEILDTTGFTQLMTVEKA